MSAFTYPFNPYSEKILREMMMGTNPLYPPHLLLEVFYSPALAHPQDAGWTVQQMGTRRFLSVGYKTREEAVAEATRIAKQMIPNGVVFSRKGAKE